jgi:hypothetical protein
MEDRPKESPTLTVFRECFAELSAAYGRTFDKHGFDAYWRVLRPLGPDRMRGAFEKAIQEERFCPSPAAIRAHAKALPVREEKKLEKPFTPITPEQAEEMRRTLQALKRKFAAMSV